MTTCTCNPLHLEIGGTDPGCPRHDKIPAQPEPDGDLAMERGI